MTFWFVGVECENFQTVKYRETQSRFRCCTTRQWVFLTVLRNDFKLEEFVL